ncbi:MAG: glycosyltransferase family 2 protein [Paludibacter sp.]
MISVCIATYNGEKYISEQIGSILTQLGSEDEIIVSDDGSTDNTIAEILKFNDTRIKLFVNNGKHGYVHNFENALKNSSGDYIFFSDQDNVWLPNKIKEMTPYLQSDNFVISNAYITDANLKVTGRISDWRKYKKGYFQNLYKSIYAGCTCAFTKNIKEYSLPFPATLYIQHDTWIGLLSELKFKVVSIDKPLIYYRRHDKNTSGLSKKTTKSLFFMTYYRLVLFFETMKRFLIKKTK